MAENIQIDMNRDWGAPGSQLTGAQVQAFIKQELRKLAESISGLNGELESVNSRLETVEKTLREDVLIPMSELDDAISTIKDIDLVNINEDISLLANRINRLPHNLSLDLADDINNVTLILGYLTGGDTPMGVQCCELTLPIVNPEQYSDRTGVITSQQYASLLGEIADLKRDVRSLQ